MIRQCLKGLALSLCVFAAGCGGGDGGDDLFGSSGSSGRSGSVEGRAVKGVLSGAVVTAEQHIDGSFQWVAETLTDATGLYAFTELPEGVIKITISAAVDGTTRMLCDAASGCGAHIDSSDDTNSNGVVDLGEWGPVPEDFSMSSITYLAGDSEQVLSVSPLTHLAAAWAEAFPGDVQADVIELAYQRVAGIFLVEAGFESQMMPALSDEGMTESDYQMAIINALFAGADDGVPGSSLAGYADSFSGLGGQMPVYGEDHTLVSLVSDAGLLAGLLDGDGAAALSNWLETLESTWGEVAVTVANTAVVTDPDGFADAESVLDELDHYLGIAGIDESGTFLATQAQQIIWLHEEEMLTFASISLYSALPILMASVYGLELEAEDLDEDGQVDLSSMLEGSGLSIIYDYNSVPQTVTITGLSQGHLVNIETEIEPLGSGTELDYALDATLINSTATGVLAGTLSIDLNDSNLEALLDAETEEQVLYILSQLHIAAEIQGTGSLAGNGEGEGAITGNLHARGEIDVPAFGDGPGVFADLELISGEICSPNLDCLYSLEGQSALHVIMDVDATAEFAFGFEAFGMPAMEMTGAGALLGASGLAQDLVDEVSASSGLDASTFVALYALLGEAISNTSGSAILTVPADDKAWQFTLENARVDVSATNDTRVVLSVFLNSVAGGYLFNGDQLVGTFTFDWENLGVTLFLVDGSTREYALGPITDLVPEVMIYALMDMLGMEPAP